LTEEKTLEMRKTELQRIHPTLSPQVREAPQGTAIIAENLSPQLGSDRKTLQEGRVDMRRLGRHDKKLTLAFPYMEYRAKKSKAWKLILDAMQNYPVGHEGKGRQEDIKAIEVSKPSMEVAKEQRRPGIIRRGWNKLLAKGE